MRRSCLVSLLCVPPQSPSPPWPVPGRHRVRAAHHGLCPSAQPARLRARPALLSSGDHGLVADYAAGGNPVPNYQHDVKTVLNGVSGSYIQCGDNQLLSYWAPGNIDSQRGTLSFFWRSRTPLDETEFPVFRVGFADHSSWDMVWLRIDWNGQASTPSSPT